jgi:hypothetical protein
MSTQAVRSQVLSLSTSRNCPIRKEPGANSADCSWEPSPNLAQSPFPDHRRDFTAAGPASRKVARITGAQTVAAQIQRPMRASNGTSTASSVIAMQAQSQMSARMAARAEGWISIIPEQVAAQSRLAGIARNIARDEITRQFRVGQLQKAGKCIAFVTVRVNQPFAHVTQQQEIQFLHAAPAAPLQPAKLDIG